MSAKWGILCGADRSQQWLLPWWWSRYRENNAFPITFCDFGMTKQMRQWCLARGDLIPIDLHPFHITPKSGIDPKLAKRWEYDYGSRVWESRLNWFKKPFALLQSPYEKTIWIDVDCEILGPLEPVFHELTLENSIALVRDHPDALVRYNGGVIAFQPNTPILQHWAEASLNMNHLFGGDDPLLSHLIDKHRIQVSQLPMAYNWRIAWGLNLSAVILHWVGTEGKAYIRKHGGIKPRLDLFFQSCKARG